MIDDRVEDVVDELGCRLDRPARHADDLELGVLVAVAQPVGPHRLQAVSLVGGDLADLGAEHAVPLPVAFQSSAAPAAGVDAARDRRAGIVGLAGEHERADVDVGEAVAVAHRAQGFAAKIAVEADPGAVGAGAKARLATAAGSDESRSSRLAPRRSEKPAGPQYQIPASSSSAGSTPVVGRQGSGMRGSRSATTAARSEAIPPIANPDVVLARATAATSASTSTHRAPRNPGIDPVWPARARPPAQSVWTPSP